MNKLILLLFCCLSIQSCKTLDERIPLTTRKYTYATIIVPHVYQSHGGSYTILYFYVNEVKYKAFLAYSACTNCVVGEKYRMCYDSLSPEDNNHVFDETPLFLPDEQTRKTPGTVLYGINETTRTISYRYEAEENGIITTYKKCQFLEKQARYYPGLAKDSVFEVEYWVKNPQRSVMHLPTPLDSLAVEPK